MYDRYGSPVILFHMSVVAEKILFHLPIAERKKCDLSLAQTTLDSPQHSLVSNCVTHWGSQQKMVERIFEQEPAIRQGLGPDRRCSHFIPTWQNVEILQYIHAVLSPLADMLSGKEHVTASAIKPLLYILQNEVLVASVRYHIGCRCQRKDMQLPRIKIFRTFKLWGYH